MQVEFTTIEDKISSAREKEESQVSIRLHAFFLPLQRDIALPFVEPFYLNSDIALSFLFVVSNHLFLVGIVQVVATRHQVSGTHH